MVEPEKLLLLARTVYKINITDFENRERINEEHYHKPPLVAVASSLVERNQFPGKRPERQEADYDPPGSRNMCNMHDDFLRRTF